MRRLAVLLLLSTLWPVSGRGADLKKVTLLPNWSPGAEFSGYYAALEKGFYRDHGIDARILRGGPDRPASESLKAGKVDAVVLWLSRALELRAQGTELVNLAQVSQRSALMLVAKKSSGIRAPKDFDGRKVGVWKEFELQPKAFFRKSGVRPLIVPQSYSINLFLRGGVDAATVMWYNEYHRLIEAGLDPDELTPFFFHEYDLNFPEDGLYVL
ncbi:MAG: ABC transporter substrate-binding protein, partial [Elusimicrobia bacterium]|nr:ABC transporter substrate-binding protein [Elusimicrobiota bacterium]